MISPETPSKPGTPARKDCGNCRDRLVEGKTYYAEPTGLEQFKETDSFGGSSFRGLMRCPICHTFYLETGEEAGNRQASSQCRIERISGEEALKELSLEDSSSDSKTAKDWLADLQDKMGFAAGNVGAD